MPVTAKDIYKETVSALSRAERLYLASLILDGLASSGPLPALVDESTAWTDQDRSELAAFSLDYAATIYPEDEDLV
jgi:hypothetical protein